MENTGYDTLSERLLQESELQSSPGASDTSLGENEGMDIFLRTPQMWRSPTHPYTDQNKKKPSILSSTYSLTSTIIGAGVLALPYAFKGAGMIYGVAFLILTACLARYSCSLLISSYLRTHKGSYDDLALTLYGPWCAHLVRITILLLNVGGVAGYMLVIKDLLAPSLCVMFPSMNSELCHQGSAAVSASFFSTEALAFITYCLVFPLSCLESLSSLQLLSKMAFLCAFFLCVSVSLRSIQSLVSKSEESCQIRLFAKEAVGVFRALPLFAFSFVCHLNVLPVYDELRSRTPSRMRRVVNHAISFCVFFYGCIGGFGYARFCDGTPQNILAFPSKDNTATAAELVSSVFATGNSTSAVVQNSFATDDLLIVGARVAETLTCSLALPFLLFPTRLALHNMVKGTCLYLKSCCRSQRNQSQAQVGPTSQLGPSQDSRVPPGYSTMVPLMEEEGQVPRQSSTSQVLLVRQDAQLLHVLSLPIIRYVECFVMLTLSFTLALEVPDISIIFGLLGSTLCSLICFVLPAAFYLKAVTRFRSDPLVRVHRVVPASWSDSKGDWWVSFKMAMAVLLLLYGIFIMIVGTTINVGDAIAIKRGKK